MFVSGGSGFLVAVVVVEMWGGSEWKGREGKRRKRKERKGKGRKGKGRARVCWVLGWEVIVWGCGLAVEVGAGRGVGDEEIGDFEAWEKMSGGMTKGGSRRRK